MNKRTTQADIARRAGISVQAVSLALRGHPSIPGRTRDRVREIANQLGYRPDPALQALVAYRTDRAAPGFHGLLAYVTNWTEDSLWQKMATYRDYFEGARVRAGQLGYHLEHFSIPASGGARRLDDILRARGVRGLILGPLPVGASAFTLTWSRYATISMGHSLSHLPFHIVANDFRSSMHSIMERVEASGRIRPALYVEEKDEERLGWRWQASFQFMQTRLPAKSRIPVLATRSNDPKEFIQWVERHQPDCLISVKIPALLWLKKAGWKVPDEIAFLTPDVPPEWKDLSGMNQNPGHLGERATDLLDMLIKNNELGPPKLRQLLIIESSWKNGKTFP